MSSAQHLYETSSIGMGNYRILDVVERELSSKQLQNTKDRLRYALKNFPELNGHTVTVGKKQENDTWYAEADWINDIIFLPTYEECPYITICHELSHLAIKKLEEQGEDVPYTSEEFCSIFAVSRMNPERIDSSRISYLGYPDVSRDKWPEICQQALDYREEHRNYIQKCKEWLEV